MDSLRVRLEEFEIKPDTYAPSPKRKPLKPADDDKFVLEGDIRIIRMDAENLEIDFIGFNTSIVNAYRRIILAEVPTMAIEKVLMYNNTSIIQDEVLSHRLGLVPLKVDPRYFEFRSSTDWCEESLGQEDTVMYELKVKCSKNPSVTSKTDPDLLYSNRKVTSEHLTWVPLGNQKDVYKPENMGPLHSDILLAKLNPKHEIDLKAVAVKGVGSDHAKFQPGLCWYRLLPEIELTRQVEGNDAKLLQKCFSPGVVKLVTTDEGKVVAQVADARYDSCSRNVFHYDSIKDAVKLTRKLDHFIFYVESHSALKSHEILLEAVNIMITKCDNLLKEINKYVE